MDLGRERKSHLLFFLIFISYIIPCHLILSHSRVKYLPGFDGPLPFTLRTGYVGVDNDEVQLFYYFIESENNPKQDPLLLWLTGGPSCSAISAILYEIGPLKFEEVMYNGSVPKLLLRKHAWTKIVNILFVDLPVGTGFSYAKTQRANHSGDYRTSLNVNQFIRKWFISYPQFVTNPLYIGGDSYSGFTLPLIVEDMSRGNEQGLKPFLNLKGYLLGNPATDRTIDHNHLVPYAHGMGLISDELYEALKRSCGGEYHTIDPSNIECNENFKAFEWGINGIHTVMILENHCGFVTQKERGRVVNVDFYENSRRSAIEDTHNQLRPFKCRMVAQLAARSCGDLEVIGSNPTIRWKTFGFNPQTRSSRINRIPSKEEGYKLVYHWIAHTGVQEALHIRKKSIGEWRRCNYEFDYAREIESSVKYHAKLSAKGFRSLIYSGDHDLVATYLGTQAWIRSLNYSIVDDWRRWWLDDQIAGFTRTYSNRMTFATVKGAGHTAPEYRPKECEAMFTRWIRGNQL